MPSNFSTHLKMLQYPKRLAYLWNVKQEHLHANHSIKRNYLEISRVKKIVVIDKPV